MNKEGIIKGINMTIEGLEAILNSLNDEDVSETKTAPTSKKSGATKAPAKTSKTPVKEESADSDQTYTRAELTGMKYNEFKKLASSLGVDCKGTRDEIMERVVALGVVVDGDEEAPVKEEKKPVSGKSDKPAKVGKAGAKKAITPAKDEFDEKAEEIAESTPVEDIISALKEVDVKATKLNYKTQLAKALREGLINVDDDGEDGSEGVGNGCYQSCIMEEYSHLACGLAVTVKQLGKFHLGNGKLPWG